MAVEAKDKVNLATPADFPVMALECTTAWNGLTSREKHYAHHISQAGWWGARICLTQLSPEAPEVFDLLQRLFAWSGGPAALRTAVQPSLGAAAVDALFAYATYFYGNLGNYTSFGDAKFVPGLDADSMRRLIGCAPLGSRAACTSLLDAFEAVAPRLYGTSPCERELGLEGAGVCTYYSPDMTRSDIELVNRFLAARGMLAYNTRLFYALDGALELRLASARTDIPARDELFESRRIRLCYGDHAPWLRLVVAHLERAVPFAANEHQRATLEQYIVAFREGSMAAHVQSQRHWIRDVGPVVESNVGFIESYRDPAGVRGEWETLVAVVNKAQSAKFNALVDGAAGFIRRLPWPAAYEKDSFVRPDFSSLDVITFASSGLPAGINLPNYDEIRQTEGFKNVSLGNVLSARAPAKRTTFVADADQELYARHMAAAFEVQVGIHELLGHGSGKLLAEAKDGTFNFDRAALPSVRSWYKPGETWSACFGALASPFEECRAECAGIYLCLDREILAVFGHTQATEAEDVAYINWLLMVRAGLVALEFYSPETDKWRQAHMQARFAILQVLLEAGGGLVTIERADSGEPVLRLDRASIETVGKAAIGAFLTQLQVLKATNDVPAASALFAKYTSVNERFLALRADVLARKSPRGVFVQPHTRLTDDGDGVVLECFEPSHNGLIQSFLTRYPVPAPPQDVAEPASPPSTGAGGARFYNGSELPPALPGMLSPERPILLSPPVPVFHAPGSPGMTRFGLFGAPMHMPSLWSRAGVRTYGAVLESPAQPGSPPVFRAVPLDE